MIVRVSYVYRLIVNIIDGSYLHLLQAVASTSVIQSHFRLTINFFRDVSQLLLCLGLLDNKNTSHSLSCRVCLCVLHQIRQEETVAVPLLPTHQDYGMSRHQETLPLE